jgi:hypothetical protein
MLIARSLIPVTHHGANLISDQLIN